MRKATRPFLVEIRRGDRHVPKTTTKPNNVAASRTPQPSHFPQNVMRHANQTFDGSHSGDVPLDVEKREAGVAD